MNLVVFDFCETLVSFQTADRFIDFICEKQHCPRRRFVDVIMKLVIKTKIDKVLERVFPLLNPRKRIKLFSLRGLSQDELTLLAREYYKSEISNNFISKTVDLLRKYLNHNDYVVIVSGGYKRYINFILEDFIKIKAVYATEIEIKNKKVTGFIDGKDCLRLEKVKILDRYFPNKRDDFDEIICISDSLSDLPLLQWGSKGIVVSKNETQTWASDYGFQEIIV